MFLAPTTVSPSVIVSDFHSVSVTKRRDDIAADMEVGKVDKEVDKVEMEVDKVRFVKETMKLDFGCWKAKFLNRGEKNNFHVICCSCIDIMGTRDNGTLGNLKICLTDTLHHQNRLSQHCVGKHVSEAYKVTLRSGHWAF